VGLSAVSPVGAGPPFRIYRWEKTTVVAVKIKLKRLGKIREPYYRIVVADARTKRDGRAIEEIGKYHPKAEPSFIEVNSERVQHWLSVGAQPTDPVRVLLKITGDWQKFTGQPGGEGTLRTAEPRADKKERFETAAKESQATKEAKEDKGRSGTQSRATKPAKDAPARESTAKESTAKESTAKKEAPAKEGKSSTSPAAADKGTDGQVKAPDVPSSAVTDAAPPADAAPPTETAPPVDAAPPADAVDAVASEAHAETASDTAADAKAESGSGA
jgi:small subunit ribosomal protein S16